MYIYGKAGDVLVCPKCNGENYKLRVTLTDGMVIDAGLFEEINGAPKVFKGNKFDCPTCGENLLLDVYCNKSKFITKETGDAKKENLKKEGIHKL